MEKGFMKSFDELKKIVMAQKILLREKYKVTDIGFFGSYVRNEQNRDSDLDILVEFEEPLSLLEFISLENHLSDITGVKVDLVMKSALKPRIGKHILGEVVHL